MPQIVLDSIAVDCPDSRELAAFYGSLLDVEIKNNSIHIHDGALEIWFQQVEGYQPPIWPTQERGQQIHFDLAAQDRDAAVIRAESLGATQAQALSDEENVVVMLDPAGHTFCMCSPWEDVQSLLPRQTDVPMITNVTVDCPDAQALATFYQQLTEYDQADFGTWGAVQGEPVGMVLFQPVENYAGPTWPTQERGQQLHFDFHTDDRPAMVEKATGLGAELKEVNKSFTVLLDPVGHPFCICDS